MPDNKMNPVVKARWLNALRLEGYQQGHAQLRRDYPSGVSAYCCLGVLCDIAEQHGKAEWQPDAGLYVGDAAFEGFTPCDSSASILPLGVARWAGLPRAEEDEIMDCNFLNPVIPMTDKLWDLLPDGLEKARLSLAGENRTRIEEISLAGLNDSGLTFDQIADIIEEHL
jgi:hypothetical protein